MLLNEDLNGLKITDMTKTSNLEGIEYIPIVQDNFNKKIDVNDMKVALDIPKLSSDLNQSDANIAASTKATNFLLSLLGTLETQVGTISSQIKTINQRLTSIEGGNISLNWNNITGKPTDEELRGPQGVQGLQGIQGIAGQQGLQGPAGLNGADGKDGVDGLPGEDGSTSYFHIKYSVNSDGNPMQDTPAKYIGTIVTQYINPPTNYQVYTWYDWKGAQGPNGNQGIPGVNGADGKTSYLHIKYGIGYDKNNVMIFTGASGEDVGPWVGMYTDHELLDSTNPSMYKWSYQKGADGKDGTAYEYIFKLTSTLTRPSTPVTSQVDDYVPDGWTDDPTDVTESTPYLWACIRTKVNNIWGNFSTPALWAKWSKDGEDGADGVTPNWISFVFKQSSTQPTTPTGTAVIPSGWVDAPTGTGVWWMSKSTINGPTGLAGAWSVPIKVTGVDGATGATGSNGSNGTNGKDGSYVLYQFAKNTSLTTSPTTGWSSTPPTLSTGEYCWMRNGTVVPPATTPASWSTGVRISGEKGDKGDTGNTGAAGPLPMYLGVYNSSTTYTGTNNVINIVKWNNGVDDFYYKTKVTSGTFSNIPPSNTLYWETFPGQFASIATEFLFAEGANIGGWIFHNDGTNDMLKSQNNSSVLNGTTGSIEHNSAQGKLITDSNGLKVYDRGTEVVSIWYYGSDPNNKIGRIATATRDLSNNLISYAELYGGSITARDIVKNVTISSNPYIAQPSTILSGDAIKMYSYIPGSPITPPSFSIDILNTPSVGANPRLKVSLIGLPTSSSGLSAGQLWNDGGVLKIAS